MDTLTAIGRAIAAKDKEQMVFDWEKAARIIKEQGAQEAEAGLAGDMEYTGGRILSNGVPTPAEETYVYLSSNHAKPLLVIGADAIECFKLESQTPGWDAHTYWPPEALAILNEE